MHELMTVKKVSERTKVSQCAIRENVELLLGILEIEERVKILEHLSFCKELRHRKVEIGMNMRGR